MDLNLKGKTALITGSSKGIGKEIARLLHDEGCNIVLNSRNDDELKNTVKNFTNVSYFAADVTNPESCKNLIKHVIEKWGHLDILVCNVGNSSSVPPGNENILEWNRVFENNFYSTTNIVEVAKNELSKTHGSIVCISSITGIEALGAPITYSVAKSALNSYVKNISKPFAKLGIRINVVAPGNILFEGSVWEKKLSENLFNIENMLKNNVALQRFGKPEEIANFVVFLCSQKSSFTTGALFVVDGGQIRS